MLVMLQDTLTQGERNLVASGRVETVGELRRAYQGLIRDEAVKLVEEETYRHVIGFMSANHFDPDMAAEVFILDPADGPLAPVPEEAEHSEFPDRDGEE